MFVAHLAHLALRTPQVAVLSAFYERVLGLVSEPVAAGGRVRLGWGRGHHALELAPGERRLDHFAFEVPDEDELAALERRLGGDARREEGALVAADPDGHRVLFLPRLDRSGERVADSRRRPIRVQHLTLGSPQRAAMVEFYVERVGFRVSDHMGDTFTWLRSDREHHSLAVVQALEVGLDHYSYDVDCWEDIKTWCDELAVHDVRVGWGPGRHGPGNNLFVIFDDAGGFRVELSAEMERYWDDRSEQEPRRWAPVSETVNLWGPVPSWRSVA